jgi:hypothetical protein
MDEHHAYVGTEGGQVEAHCCLVIPSLFFSLHPTPQRIVGPNDMYCSVSGINKSDLITIRVVYEENLNSRFQSHHPVKLSVGR